jgi:hypothetical protein
VRAYIEQAGTVSPGTVGYAPTPVSAYLDAYLGEMSDMGWWKFGWNRRCVWRCAGCPGCPGGRSLDLLPVPCISPAPLKRRSPSRLTAFQYSSSFRKKPTPLVERAIRHALRNEKVTVKSIDATGNADRLSVNSNDRIGRSQRNEAAQLPFRRQRRGERLTWFAALLSLLGAPISVRGPFRTFRRPLGRCRVVGRVAGGEVGECRKIVTK